MRGLFFSIDALFGVIIAIILITAFSVIMLQAGENRTSGLFLSKIADDALVSLDKNDTLDTLDSSKINTTLAKILPKNSGYILDVSVFQCNSSECLTFSKVVPQSFTISVAPSTEKNPVIAKRVFLTFNSNNLVDHFNKAELKVWLR